MFGFKALRALGCQGLRLLTSYFLWSYAVWVSGFDGFRVSAFAVVASQVFMIFGCLGFMVLGFQDFRSQCL